MRLDVGVGVPHASLVVEIPPRPNGDTMNAPGPETGDAPPAPGQLMIKEQRSWRTWQLSTAAGAAVVFGMFLGNLFAGGSTKRVTVERHGRL